MYRCRGHVDPRTVFFFPSRTVFFGGQKKCTVVTSWYEAYCLEMFSISPLDVQYSLPDYYILRFFSKEFRKNTPKNTTKPGNIPRLLHFFFWKTNMKNILGPKNKLFGDPILNLERPIWKYFFYLENFKNWKYPASKRPYRGGLRGRMLWNPHKRTN